MCDTEIHFNNLTYSQNERIFAEDQRSASLWYLAFWSNQAWFRGTQHSSLSAAAVREWVAYHRLSVAQNKETVTQIIGGVKGVIPNSKLAKYGDYSYNIDFEDMCCIAEDVDAKPHILKTQKSAYARRYDFWASETKTSVSDRRDNDLCPVRSRINLTDPDRSQKSLRERLKVLHQVLLSVKQIANEAQLLDSWTETLLKICLRFVCVLRNNENLAKLLEYDISFIIDYQWLRKIPISKIELQSIPQLENRGDIFSDPQSVETLWLKLTSLQISKIWKKDTRVPFPFDDDNQSSKHLVPLIKINFLRSRKSKSLDYPRKNINIPKNMERELLGSLLDVMNENLLQPDITLTKVDGVPKIYFPEAHGEWTKQLFPHRFNFNHTSVENSAIRQPWNAASTLRVPQPTVRLDGGSSEPAVLPMQYYKTVPPPIVAVRMRSPYIHYQPRNRLVLMPANNLFSDPSNQQVQYKVRTAPVSSTSPVAYVSQASLSQNCNVPQRLSAPIHAGQYHRLNFIRAPYQHNNLEDTKEPHKYQSKIIEDKSSSSEKILIRNEEKDLNEEKHVCDNTEAKHLTSIPVTTTAPFVQLNLGYNIPFRLQQNVGNTIGKANNTLQAVATNPQSQVYESKMPLKKKYPITSYRLRIPLIKNAISPRNQYILPQFTSKPRFLGSITIDNIKRINEKLFQQRQYDYINGPLCQDVEKNSSENIPLNLKDTSTDYEEKVEKWLESVNECIKSGSCINLEELSDDHNKLDTDGKGDCADPEKWQNESASEVLQPKSICDDFKTPFLTSNANNRRNPHENVENISRYKKMKAKRLLLEQVHLFRYIAAKLKRCKNSRRKIKIVKKYFAEINSVGIKRIQFENVIKIPRNENSFIKKVEQWKREKNSALKQGDCLRMKLDKQLSTESNFDMHQSCLLINDASKNKVFIRESQEFNVFPSKRMKMSNPQPSFFETEVLIRDKRSRWISSLNYFDFVIDGLFFAAGNDEIHDRNQDKMMKEETKGWNHFKFSVKTVMKNLISSLAGQNL